MCPSLSEFWQRIAHNNLLTHQSATQRELLTGDLWTTRYKAVFCWETLGPSINTQLNIGASPEECTQRYFYNL